MCQTFSYHFDECVEHDRTDIEIMGEGYIAILQEDQETGDRHTVVLSPLMKTAFMQAWEG